jgi:hypothetical protein
MQFSCLVFLHFTNLGQKGLTLLATKAAFEYDLQLLLSISDRNSLPNIHFFLGLPSECFPRGFLTKLLCAFLVSLVIATCRIRRLLLDFTITTILRRRSASGYFSLVP